MDNPGLPQNNSHQHLMNDDSDSTESRLSPINVVKPPQSVTKTQWLTVGILCFVNLINYMDRYTIAGIMEDVKKEFDISNEYAGLLQTAFVLSYMIFAPLFGYLGDRYSRRLIMAGGVFLWCLTTLLGSFMNSFGLFIAFRAFVGIGEASYSTIAPTIISDLFVKNVRARMLALFYFAIPVGSGLGYIAGSETAKFAESWRWALRVTPVMGGIAVLLILFLVHDPKRGESEGHTQLTPTSWSDDLKQLMKNPSFMFSTMGFTCVSFVAGALAWWGPRFIYLGVKLQPNNSNVHSSDVSYKFGIITMVSGIIGVPLGQIIAQKLKPRFPRADPLICAVGLLLSTPFLFFASILSSVSSAWCFTFIFFGELFLNLNWAIVADILLYVVIPTRRSSAEAFQILISHAFGDAGSPYLIGVISDALMNLIRTASVSTLFINSSTTTPGDDEVEFRALQYALYTTSFVEILGCLFFLVTAMYIVKDKFEAERATENSINNQPRNLYADLSGPD